MIPILKGMNKYFYFIVLIILSISVYPDYKEEVRSLIKKNTMSDGTIHNKAQIQSAIANFSVKERQELYNTLKKDAVLPTILNIIPLGLGSLLQGDSTTFYVQIAFMSVGTLCGCYLYFLYPWDDPFGSFIDGIQSIFLFIPAWEVVIFSCTAYVFSLLMPGIFADYWNGELAVTLKLDEVSMRISPVIEDYESVYSQYSSWGIALHIAFRWHCPQPDSAFLK
jgi:hypothetical protein